MKRAYAKSQYAKPCERYCLEVYPDEAEAIFASAEKHYLEFMRDMPAQNQAVSSHRRFFSRNRTLRRQAQLFIAYGEAYNLRDRRDRP